MRNFTLLLLALSSSAHAAAEAEICGALPSGSSQSLQFCERANPDSNVLLVYFHGIGMNEHRLSAGPRAYAPLSSLPADQIPSVLSLSFGMVRFLSGEELIAKAADAVAARISSWKSRLPLRRVLLIGDSMGGFNALQIFLRHPEAFDRAAFLCPAITATSPFASNEDWDRDPDTQNAYSVLRFGYRRMLWWNFKDAGEWNASSPLSFLENSFRAPSKLAPIYIGNVEGDRYGFGYSHQRLQQLLASRGYSVSLRTTHGAGHCNVESEPLVNFLLEP